MYVYYYTSSKKIIRGHLRGGFLRRNDGREMDFQREVKVGYEDEDCGFLMYFLRGLMNKNLNEIKVGKVDWAKVGFLLCRGRL